MIIDKLYNTEKNKYILYNQYTPTQKNRPSVLFLHGLMSDMSSKKSRFLEEYCKQHNYHYITFDNFGHGKSQGSFIEETIESWLEGVELIFKAVVKHPIIVVGSSMGAWLAMLIAQKFPNKIKALICIAPAVDFTQEAIWNRLPAKQQQQMVEQGWLQIKGEKDCSKVYPISYQLITNARKYLLLNTDILLTVPVHLIHGMADTDIPYTISSKLVEQIDAPSVVMKLIKDGNHQLSRETDLAIITNSIEEVISYEIGS